MPKLLTIVIAWVVDDVEVVRPRRTDLGERPVTRDIRVAKTAVWLNEGKASDIKKARVYAAANGHYVFTFPTDTSDAREQAARRALNKDRKASTTTK